VAAEQPHDHDRHRFRVAGLAQVAGVKRVAAEMLETSGPATIASCPARAR